jgi:hypothetical protein
MPKKKSAAKPRSSRSSSSKKSSHPTGPNVEIFEPSHGPNVDDRSDLISPRSVSPEKVKLAGARQRNTGDAGQEVEKAGQTGGTE